MSSNKPKLTIVKIPLAQWQAERNNRIAASMARYSSFHNAHMMTKGEPKMQPKQELKK